MLRSQSHLISDFYLILRKEKKMADEVTTRKRIRLGEETDKESSNEDQPLLESHLDKLKSIKKTIKEVLDWARLVVVCFAAGAIMIGVIYNFFVNTEKDIPDVVFQKLYKFMEVQAAAHVTSSPIENHIEEWIHLPAANETSN